MGINDNTDATLHRDANVDNTTRQGNTYDGADPPVLLKAEKPEDSPEELEASAAAAAFDPGDHTVAEVKDYVTAHPDRRDAVYEAEESGKARVTLLDWLVNQA